MQSTQRQLPTQLSSVPQFSRPSGIGFPRATSSNSCTWSPNSFSACEKRHKTRSMTMSVEIFPVTATTAHRAKMAYIYIRQSSLMQ